MIKKYILAIILLLISIVGKAQSGGDVQLLDSQMFVEKLTSSYKDWNKIELSGKIEMKGLPLNPSTKIFMIRDSVIRISIRAPFVGEVARVELDNDSILAVNKLKQNYFKTDINQIKSITGLSIGNLQDLFLARAFVVGIGTLNVKMADYVNVLKVKETEAAVYPIAQPNLFQYIFLCNDSLFEISAFAAETVDNNAMMYLSYTHTSKTDIELNVKLGDTALSAHFIYDRPNFSPKNLESVEINRKWKQVGLKEFLKF